MDAIILSTLCSPNRDDVKEALPARFSASSLYMSKKRSTVPLLCKELNESPFNTFKGTLNTEEIRKFPSQLEVTRGLEFATETTGLIAEIATAPWATESCCSDGQTITLGSYLVHSIMDN